MGNQAYPTKTFTTQGLPNGHDMGLTKREHFAGLALQGLLAGVWADPHVDTFEPKNAADLAVEYADALIERLAQPEGGDA